MASSNCGEGPPTPVRKSRRSWFDTPPLTTLDPKPIQNENVRPTKPKRKSLDTVETLTLTHFSSVPRLGFGNAVVGTTKFRTLLIRNPHEYEQEVIIEKFPFKKKFYVEHTRFDVAPGEVFSLEIMWTPEEAAGVREMILLHVSGVYRLQCFIFGTAENPKPVKKVRRGRIGPQVRKNSLVIQTPALTRIKSNYSPRRSQELRDLQALVENKEFHHNRATSESILHEKVVDQSQLEASINCKEFKTPSCVLVSDNQENVRLDPVAMTPTPLESTSIGISLKNGEESSSRGYNKWRKPGLVLPSLTTMSPIPLSDGNENGITVDSYFRCSEVFPVGDKMKDLLAMQSLPHSKPKDFFRNDLTPSISEQTVETTYIVPSVLPGAETQELKALENETMSPLMMEVKKRVDWHTPQKGNLANVSGQSPVSPNTILDQSLSLITQISSPNDNLKMTYNHDADASINNLISQSLVAVSPNSFMEDMKQMGSFHDGDVDKLSSNDGSSGKNVVPSPSSIFSSTIPHTLMIEHLNNVRSSLSNSPSIKNRPVKKRRSLTSVYRAAEKKTILAAKVSPRGGKQRMRRTSGKLTDCNRMRSKFSEKPSFEDSPRRGTFVVQKKEKGTMKRNSPLKKAKMMSSKVHLRKSPLNKQKRYSRSSPGKRGSPKLSKHQRLLNCSTPYKQSPNVIDSGTIVKNKSYNSFNSPPSPLVTSRDSLNSSPNFSAISPSHLPLSPGETNVSRRGTLTVTKSRPSDVLLAAMSNNNRKKLFNQESPTVRVSESGENLIAGDKDVEHVEGEGETSESTPHKFHTPTNLPASPNPENSRRSTHVVRSPKVLDLSVIQQKCLNFETPDMEMKNFDVGETPITAVCLMSPQIVDYEVTSEDSSQQSVSKDSLETSLCNGSFRCNDVIERSGIECENRVDVKVDVGEKAMTTIKLLDQELEWSYCEESNTIRQPGMALQFDTVGTCDGSGGSVLDGVQNLIEKEELMAPPVTLPLLSKTCDERSAILCSETFGHEPKVKRKLRRSASANEILSTVFNIDVSEFQSEVSNCTQMDESIDCKPYARKENKCRDGLNNRGQTLKTTTKASQDKITKTASQTQLRSNVKASNSGNLATFRGISRSLTNIDNTSSAGNKIMRRNQEKAASSKAVKNTDKTVSVPTKSGALKPKKGPVKGVAQSKLILVKKPKSAVPRHPMPFAARNMYYDERWMEKQEKGFVQWLNFVLTPPDEYVAVTSKPKVDAVALTLGNQHMPARLAPTKEVLSFRAYAARRRLNRLRRAACQLYQSDGVVPVIRKVEVEVESRRIAVRKEKMMHADLGIRQRLLDLLLQYSSLWLRIGLETIFGEVIMLQSNTDVLGMSRFIVTRLLGCPDIAAQYAHPTVPHLYTEGFAPALSRHTVKKFLLLVYFLDRAKSSKLIDHDPCLFCKDADIKCSKEILIQFSREVLSGEGDLNRHLAYLGYTVSHVQKPFDEFDYAVTKLSTDLKDGLRLCRVLELLAEESGIMMKLRTPAISRLQKIHNLEAFFSAMSQRGLKLDEMSGSTARDVVDGHREKTLAVLWHLILHFQANVNVDEEKLKEEIHLLKKSLGLKLAMQKIGAVFSEDSQARRESGEPNTFVNNERMQLIFRWCRLVCLHYGVKLENMTVSFSDGRALCCLLHHYHPALLPLSEIQFQTSIRFQEKAEDLCDGEDPDLSVDWGKKGGLCPQEDDPTFFEQLLANEKSNFKVLYEKVSALGGVPLMVKHSDMSNTIPDEKVVTTYVSYLCARLLDIREEVRAARVIQMAWRRRRLQRTFQERLHAVQVIQTCYRKHLKAKRAQELIAMEERKHKMEESAIKVQTTFKAFRERKHFLKMKAASVCLQSMWRMRKAQMLVNLMKQELEREKREARDMVEREAAIVIQKSFRGYTARQDIIHLKDCVVVVQSLWRMQRARMVVKLKRQEKEEEERERLEHKAAGRIQKVYRGFRIRRDLNHLRKCTVVLQSMWRMHKGRSLACEMRKVRDREAKEKREMEAAVMIQKVFKGHRVRRDFKYLKKCTIVVQSLWRMHKAKLILDLKKEEKARIDKEERESAAAVMIQKCFRGFGVRKEMKHLERCTLVLQTLWRMQKAKCFVMEMRVEKERKEKEERWKQETLAAVKIQKLYRGFKERKDLTFKKNCALVLQCFWRVQMAKKVVKIKQQELAKIRMETKAATTIQSFVRGWMFKVRFEEMRHGAICIQKMWRGFLGRKKAADMLRQETSAIVIQKYLRGWITRQNLERKREAAVCIQRQWRLVLIFRFLKEEEERRRAACTIQSHFKGYICRQKYQKMKRACICLQSMWRMRAAMKLRMILWTERKERAAEMIYKTFLAYHYSRLYNKKKTAAIVIQKKWKMLLASRKLESLRYSQQTNAAICIQSNYRAFIGRQDFLKVKRSVMTLQTSWRCFMARQKLIQLQFERKEKAACVLQAFVKGSFQRQNFLQLKESAIIVQKMWRMRQAMLELKTLRLERKTSNATAIQKSWRGYCAWKTYREMRKSTICIQAQWRMIAQRRDYCLLRESTMTIQSSFRRLRLARQERKEFLEQRAAAVVIQSVFRGAKARKVFLKKREAAICIQKNFRSFRKRIKFLAMKYAVITIQRVVRNTQLMKKTRRDYLEYIDMKNAATTLQLMYERNVRMRQECAAIVIQTAFRRFHVCRWYNRQKEAVLHIQSWFRSVQAMKEDRAIYLESRSSAVTIQAFYKMYTARKEFCKKREAVIRLQAFARRIHAEEEFHLKRNATMIIQYYFRAWKMGKIFRQAFVLIRSSCIVIQRFYRKERARRARAELILLQNTAASKLQACYKCCSQRKKYLALKSAVLVVQDRFRAIKAARAVRVEMEKRKEAAIAIQKGWRDLGLIRDAKGILETKREEARKLEKQKREEKRRKEEVRRTNKAAAILQQAWKQFKLVQEAKLILEGKREEKRCKEEVRRTNKAAAILQQAWKQFKLVQEAKLILEGKREEKRCKEEVRRTNKAAAILQQAWKQFKLVQEAKLILEGKREEKRCKEEVRRTNKAAAILQQAWKQFKLVQEAKLILEGKREEKRRKKEVRRTNKAAAILQQAWKQFKLVQEAKLILEGKRELRRIEEESRIEERKRDEEIKKLNAAVMIQRQWKQLKLMREAKVILEIMREKARTEEEERKAKLEVLLLQNTAAKKCQALYRMHTQRQKYLALKSSTTCIQRKFRRMRRERAERFEMERRLSATVILQTAWRQMKLIREAKIILDGKKEDARKAEEEERQKEEDRRRLKEKVYEEMHVKAVVTLQKYVRSFLQCLHERRCTAAAIVLQKYVRGYVQRRKYRQTVHRVILLQTHARMFIQRQRFGKYRASVCLVQQKWREILLCRREHRELLSKIKAVCVIQSWYRKMRRAKIEKAATTVQALWRGFVVRRDNTSKKLKRVRKRLEEANQSVQEKDTLGSRTSSALDYLLTNKDMSYVLTALMHLEVGTRLSPVCCERLVEANAVEILVRLLNSCNRSVPHMEVIKYIIDILLNLAKYEKTVDSILCVENVTAVILDLMQVYREKGAIFFKSCTLMGILAMDPYRRQTILTGPNISGRIQSMHSLAIRKHRTTTKRQVTQAKLSSMKSFNCTLPVSTPSKSRQKKIQPDWILNRRSNWATFDDPLTAINFVMTSLRLGAK